jgi:hypothetical protein
MYIYTSLMYHNSIFMYSLSIWRHHTMAQERIGYAHAHGAPAKGKILMVAGSPTTSTQTGWPIGFWAA